MASGDSSTDDNLVLRALHGVISILNLPRANPQAVVAVVLVLAG